jgi:hypothetical protein
MSKQTAPFWCPNAVATKLGWQDPITNEVYVCDTTLAIATVKPKSKKKSFKVESED